MSAPAVFTTIDLGAERNGGISLAERGRARARSPHRRMQTGRDWTDLAKMRSNAVRGMLRENRLLHSTLR